MAALVRVAPMNRDSGTLHGRRGPVAAPHGVDAALYVRCVGTRKNSVPRFLWASARRWPDQEARAGPRSHRWTATAARYTAAAAYEPAALASAPRLYCAVSAGGITPCRAFSGCLFAAGLAQEDGAGPRAAPALGRPRARRLHGLVGGFSDGARKNSVLRASPGACSALASSRRPRWSPSSASSSPS